jgi:hypothetical protein
MIDYDKHEESDNEEEEEEEEDEDEEDEEEDEDEEEEEEEEENEEDNKDECKNSNLTVEEGKEAVENNYIEVQSERFMFKDSIDHLRHLRDKMLVENSMASELPYDNSILQFSSIVTFIVEHISNFTEKLITKFLSNDPDNNIIIDIEKIIFNRFTNYTVKRQHFIQFLKVSYLKLLIALIQNSNLGENLNFMLKYIDPIRLYEDIIYYTNQLLTAYKEQGKINKYLLLSSDEFSSAFQELYVFDKSFQDSMDLKFCLLSFKFIKILADKYKIESFDKYYKDNAIYLLANKGSTDDNSYYSIAGLRVYEIYNDLVRKVEVSADDDFINIYYIRPPITFMLTEPSKMRFYWTIDRSSTLTKLTGLIRETDYFIYEMLYNHSQALDSETFMNHLFKLGSYLPKFLKQFKIFEVINIIVIIIHQLILLSLYIKPIKNATPEGFTRTERFSTFSSNYVLAIMQMVYITLVALLRIKIYSKLYFQYLVMKKYHMPFIMGEGSTKIVSFTNNSIKDNKGVFDYVSGSMRFWDKLYVTFFDIILNNSNINTLFFTFILLFAYLITSNNLCLAIPILFIVNLSETLNGIVYAIRLRWQQLLLVIFYIYLIVYLYTWIAFLYLTDLLNIGGITVVGSVTTLYNI